jgi:hypothetical protein
MSDKFKKQLEVIADKNEKRQIKLSTKMQLDEWRELGLSNPYRIVEKFIKDKGLKLYGGQALHEHLAKHGKGLYTKDEFPDYDVFSPDAWNHAKELADILYNVGYSFIEAKGSILNDDHHQTYKVGVDMIAMLDLTQIGCVAKQVVEDDCAKCGVTDPKTKKCISIFNEIPCVDVNDTKYEIYNRVYDYKKDASLYKTKMFIASPEWLKVSMYQEMTQPLNNSARLPKVAMRMAMFDKFFQTKLKTCTKREYLEIVDDNMKKILRFIGNYVKGKELINIGASAHNIFVKNSKQVGSLAVTDYKVYTINNASAYKLLAVLKTKYPKTTFKIYERYYFWKTRYDNETIISVKTDSGKYNNLITFIEHTTCMPYIKYDGVRYATFNMLKHLYYMGKELPELFRLTEHNPLDYECLLSELMASKKSSKKKTKKFRRFISKCQGNEEDKRGETIVDRWSAKIRTLKKTKYYIDNPKKGYITKVLPMEKTKANLPYKPEETHYKTYIYKDQQAVENAWQSAENKNNAIEGQRAA